MPFKKIFKPIAKVLDKVIPNEIKPALPYLAAFAPVFGPPGVQNFLGSTMGRRALTSGLLNIGAQLSQEGSEGDINLLSAGLGALSGAMTTPGAAGDLRAMKTFDGRTIADIGEGTIAGEATGLEALKNKGLEALAKGSDILRPAGEMPALLSKAGAKAATLPAATATGDVMQAQARQLEKQAAIDAALEEAAALGEDANRALALRTAMEAYGFFTDEEIEDTIASAGYKAGGRVGFNVGGPTARQGLSALLGSEMPAREGMEDRPFKFNAQEFMINQYNEDGIQPEIIGSGFQGDDEIFVIRTPNGGTMTITHEQYTENFGTPEKGMKEGGLMDLGGKEMDLRKGGFVPIGKKERADDVPARLSKNEFVMTADAVRAAGGGSVNKGAKRMYNLMNTLEARA